MFEKGDYIVCLKVTVITSCIKRNYCVKQREDSTCINPELDLDNINFNGNAQLTFNNFDRFKWRYATSQEIQEYDRLGKPYDTTTLTPQEISYEIY